MSRKMTKLAGLEPTVVRFALIGGHILALAAYLLGLEFLLHTNGGTLFLFSTASPLFAGMATLIIAGLLIYRFTKRQSLFAFAVFEPGDMICMQGDEAHSAYFIQSGEVEVVRREDGADNVIARLSKGHHFGESALVSNTPHYVTVRAVTRTRIAALGRRNFLSILRYAPFAHHDILQAVNQKAFQQAARRARRKSPSAEEN